MKFVFLQVISNFTGYLNSVTEIHKNKTIGPVLTYQELSIVFMVYQCPPVRPFHMSHSNLRTPWPIHFKFHRVIGIDGLTVCILYGEISNFHSRVMELYSSNCRQFFVCRAVN
jgi:hypothetical protein